jgi:hypothetical protein
MKNINSIRQINKPHTKWIFYFMALLKEGAYIKKQTYVVDNKEVVSYEIVKDFHPIKGRYFSNIIYCNCNYEAVKKLLKIGFKMRTIKGKSYLGGQTSQLFFSDYSKPQIKYNTQYQN